MSRFGSVSTLNPNSSFIILTKDENDKTQNSQITAKVASEQLGVQRWMLPPPSGTLDPRGVDGSESYDSNYYYIKIGVWKRIALDQNMFG